MKLRILPLSLAWASFHIPPSMASLTIEQRLDLLESEVTALREENARLKNAPFHDTAVKTLDAPSKTPPAPPVSVRQIKLGGFIQMQADAGDRGDARFSSANDRFYLRRARINTTGTVTDFVSYKLELDLAGSLSETSATRAQATEAWIACSLSPLLRVTAGQFKTPFGFEQLSSDLQSLTVERSLATDRLTLNRQIGAQLDGAMLDRFTYAIGAFNGTGVTTSANDNDAFLWAARGTARLTSGRIAGHPAAITIGANAFTSHDASVSGMAPELLLDSVAGGVRDNIFSGKRDGIGCDLHATVGNLDLRSEYLRIHFTPVNSLPDSDFTSKGWYVQSAWLFPSWHIQGVIKYELFDTGAAIGDTTTRTRTAGINWLIKGQDLKLMTDFLVSDVPDLAVTQKKLLVRLQSVF